MDGSRLLEIDSPPTVRLSAGAGQGFKIPRRKGRFILIGAIVLLTGLAGLGWFIWNDGSRQDSAGVTNNAVNASPDSNATNWHLATQVSTVKYERIG